MGAGVWTRAAAVYFILLVLIRISGKRTLAETTAFDFVLLLIISEAAQQALLGDDFSITNGTIVVATLIAIDIGLARVSQHREGMQKVLDSVPLILVEDGRMHHDRMKKAAVNEDEILHAARELQGLESMSQVKYAVLERGGGISIIPRQGGASRNSR